MRTKEKPTMVTVILTDWAMSGNPIWLSGESVKPARRQSG